MTNTHSLAVLAGIGAVLVLVYLWRITIHRADAVRRNPPPSPTPLAWKVAVFTTLLAALALIAWTWRTWRE
jgi:hypothetical protein